MNLFELFAKLTLDTSEYESGMNGAASLAENVADKIGGALKTAAKVGAAALSAASAAVGAITKQAVDGFGEYEQLAGGIETLFGDAAGTVKDNAEKAFETAGMSANDYMEMVTSFAGALLKSSGDTTEKLTEQQIQAQSDALDKQYDLQQRAYNKQETALKRSLDRRYKAVQKAYDEQYRAAQKSYDKQYKAAKKSYDNQYQAMSDAIDDEIEKRQDAYDKEERDLQRSQEREVAALEKATDKRLELIDKEYTAAIRAIDKEQAARLKNIDDQISAITGASEAERQAREKSVSDDKKAELEKALSVAKTKSRREEIQKELTQFLEDEAYKQREAARRAQIDQLRDQKDAIKEETANRKTAAKEERDEKVDAVKKSSAAQLSALKDANKKELEELKRKNKEELESFKKGKKQQLEALHESQQESLSNLRESQQERLSAMRDGQQEELERLRQSQDDQLTATKEHHSDLLKELKRSIAEQKKATKSGADEAQKNTKVTAAQQREAAKLADMAIIDMSDNVNKLGTNMDMVQNAYKGFSRGNFTMLDNLQLGFAGTKEGMQELLNRAEQISGFKYDISSYGDIVNAIHVVQTEMGITGTTQREAESTIQGSLARLKAAWSNLVTSFGRDDADLSENINQTVESAKTYLGNLMPVIERAIEGIGQFVREIAPIIIAELPGMVEQILPPLLDAATALLSGLIQALPTLITVLIEQIPFIATELFNAIVATGPQFIEAGKQLLDFIASGLGGLGDDGKWTDIVDGIVNKIGDLISTYAPKLIDSGLELMGNLVTGIWNKEPEIIKKVEEIIQRAYKWILDNAPRFAQSGTNLISKLIDGIAKNGPRVLKEIVNIVLGMLKIFLDHLPQMLQTGFQLLGQLLAGIIKALPDLEKGIWGIIKDIFNWFGSVNWAQIGLDLLIALAKGIIGASSYVGNAIGGITDEIWRQLSGIAYSAFRWGQDIIGGLVDGIWNMIGSVGDAASNVANTIWSYLHFSEPEIGPLANFHTFAPDMMKTFAKGIRDNERIVKDQVAKSFDFGSVGEISGTAASTSGTTSGTTTYNNTFNIYQREGEDMEALARRISEIQAQQMTREGATFA